MAEGEADEFHDSDYEVIFDTLPSLDVLGDNDKMFEGHNGPCLDPVGNSSNQGSNGLHTDMTSTAAVPGSGQCGIVDSRRSLAHAPKHPVVHSAVSNGANMYLLNGAGHSQGNNNGGHSSFSNGVGHVQVNTGSSLDPAGNFSIDSNGLHTAMTSTAAVPGSGQCGIVDSRSSLAHAPKNPVVHSAVSNGADMYLSNGAGHSRGNNNGGHSSFSNGVGHVQVNTGSSLDPVGNFSIDSNGLHTAMTRSAVVPGSGQRLPGVVDTRSSVAHAAKHPVVHTPTFSNGAPSYLSNGAGHSRGNNNGGHSSFSNGVGHVQVNTGSSLDPVGNFSIDSNGLRTAMTRSAVVPGSGQRLPGVVDTRRSVAHAAKHPVVHTPTFSNGAPSYLSNGAGHSRGNNNGGHSSFSNGVGHVQVNTGSSLDPVGNFSIDSNGLHTAMTRSAVVPGSGQRLQGVVDTRSSVAHAAKHPVVHTPTFSNGAPSYLSNGVGQCLNNNGAHTSFSNRDLRHFQGNTGPSLYHAENLSVQRSDGWLARMAIIRVMAPDLSQKRGKNLDVANSGRPLLPKYLGFHSSVQGSMVGEWENGGRQDREDWIANKTRKMMKNRDSAAKSRARKVAYQMQVEMEKAKLMAENESLRTQIESLTMFNSQIERPLRRTRSSPW
ncbi:unnamed protein product [Calypogeia fissa]